MNTASTKSRNRKGKDAKAGIISQSDAVATLDDGVPQLAWRIASISVVAVAVFVRLYQLGLRPMHHDEGVNGFFLTNLYRNGAYQYDPTNYHGPTLYYFGLILTKINGLFFGEVDGLSTVAVRLLTVAFGVATIWLVLRLRRNIGAIGALSAAALIAVSPGAVFLSRYFIHEAQFVFFTVGVVVAVVRYYETADPVYLLLAALSAALLFATKETAIISAGVLGLAFVFATTHLKFGVIAQLLLAYTLLQTAGIYLATRNLPAALIAALVTVGVCLVFGVVAQIYVWVRDAIIVPKANRRATKEKRESEARRRSILNQGALLALATFGGALLAGIVGSFFSVFPKVKVGFFALPVKFMLITGGVCFLLSLCAVAIDIRHKIGLLSASLLTLAAFLLFLGINVLFYSSFFRNFQGVNGAIQSLSVWAGTGTKDHAHEWYTYLNWLRQEELALLILGTAGTIIALIRSRNRFVVFCGAWTFGTLAAYTLIPYKTPWLMLSVTVPLAIVAGSAINELYHLGKVLISKVTALLALAIALSVAGTQTVILNFIQYDDERHPYVYAHTRREFLDLVSEIESLAARAQLGNKAGIAIVSPDYWPLPWYLRNYQHAGFFGRLTNTEHPLVVGSVDQISDLEGLLGERYALVNSYPLRPGVTLVLYAKRELLVNGSRP